MGTSSDESPHALVVSSSEHGHVVGSMLLSEALASLGFKVSFIYFSSYHGRLKERKRLVLPSPERRGHFSLQNTTASGYGSGGGNSDDNTHIVSNSNGVEVGDTFPTMTSCGGTICLHVVDDGFAPGDIDKHFFVTSAMKDNLYKLIVELREQGHPPTCLISDSFVPWTLQVAQRASIPRVEFWTSNAFSHQIICHSGSLFSEGILPEKGSPTQWKRETPLMLSHIPGLPPFSSELIPIEIRYSDASDPLVQFFNEVASCVESGERILVHSMLELEPSAFKAFKIKGIPAYAIGPLSSPLKKQAREHTNCLHWLNLQPESSVIYVAFGSFASLSLEEMQELAMGLEASGNPFLWVIREDALKGEELPHVLLDGFLERTNGKGLIISWAPQVEVLAHKAVGGFLSHCGWNSTLESMWEGVPMLCCPRFAEQRVNSHYLCNEWGAGLELERTHTGGLDKSFVELGVKALMQNEEGFKARTNAQEIMHLAKKTCQQGGQSFTILQKFYDDMKVLSSKPSSHTSS